jgi:hypothetical protein
VRYHGGHGVSLVISYRLTRERGYASW